MAYSDWTDREWDRLIDLVHQAAPTGLSDAEIREAAWGYMQKGPDGGGNRFGVTGTMVAVYVDKVNRELHEVSDEERSRAKEAADLAHDALRKLES